MHHFAHVAHVVYQVLSKKQKNCKKHKKHKQFRSKQSVANNFQLAGNASKKKRKPKSVTGFEKGKKRKRQQKSGKLAEDISVIAKDMKVWSFICQVYTFATH
jgi:hypothetical protein